MCPYLIKLKIFTISSKSHLSLKLFLPELLKDICSELRQTYPNGLDETYTFFSCFFFFLSCFLRQFSFFLNLQQTCGTSHIALVI